MIDYIVDMTQEQYNSCYMKLMDYHFKDHKINAEIILDYFKKDELGIDESKMLFSINKKDVEVFEKYLILNKLKFERLENYNLDSFANSESIEKILVICNAEINPIEEGRQTLNEELIKKKDSIKMYVRSHEQGSHYIPHVHFDYKGQNNICSISLIDHKILANSQDIPSKLKKEFDKLIDDNIVKAIKYWNASDAILGLRQRNDGTLEQYEKESNS